jgi:hypothetical protein
MMNSIWKKMMIYVNKDREDHVTLHHITLHYITLCVMRQDESEKRNNKNISFPCNVFAYTSHKRHDDIRLVYSRMDRNCTLFAYKHSITSNKQINKT